MDGYAVLADDLAGPWRVIGESAAGHPFSGEVAKGEAVRISTGAMMPEGLGAVVLQEDIARDADRLALTGDGPDTPGRHVRRLGLDFCEGASLLEGGSLLGPVQAALAIAGGYKHVPVRRRPRVVVLDTGDELCPEDERCAPHQIPASNGPMLTAMIGAVPSVVRRVGPIPDDLDMLAEAFEGMDDADVIVSSGGASVGDHDLMRPALEAWGARIDFWRVAIKPGKPLLVATRDTGARKQIILGLPGNPASTYVTAFLFLLPLLRAMLGAAAPLPLGVQTRLAVPLDPGGSRREFLRAHWDGASVRPMALQDSGVLATLAASNAVIDRAAHAPTATAGEEALIYLLANGGIA
jgi:molybdopterin molybdotransferase